MREADTLLQQALALDPKNAFTLNNMGVAKESQGEYGEAPNYYNAAANTHVEEPVIVTMNGSWRGKAVSDIARSSRRSSAQAHEDFSRAIGLKSRC